MKYINLFCIAVLLMASCSSNNEKSSGKDTLANSDTATTAKVNDTAAIRSLCFLGLAGKTSQDSTSIELVIKDKKVTGMMNWLPYQKDSRKGLLEGTVKGDTIQAVWTFTQEGMKDTLNLKFRLQNDVLYQKPLKLNTKTGREQTDESAGYTLSYPASNKVHH